MVVIKNTKARNAFIIGGLCSLSYFAVYIARNILGAVTPQMIEQTDYTTEYIGTTSSMYFIFYAVGQLLNGAIGDKIKARYMISFGLILAGITNIVFPYMSEYPFSAQIVYGMTGFFLSMIYGPMTKVVSENTEPEYAVRCSLGYTFASFFGSPIAGLMAAFFAWQTVFRISSIVLFSMGVFCFVSFLFFERSGIVKYNQYKKEKETGGVKVLIENRIIRFTFISIITGVVRTTVVFWMPTYVSQYLGFSAELSAGIFTVSTLIISFTTFIAVFVYEQLGRNMELTIFLSFVTAAIAFLAVYFVKMPILNIVFLVIAIMAANGAASMIWSRYCPGLRDTGMVSTATGFLDFVSYMAASASSMLFSNAVAVIGWGNLVLIWFGLMIAGIAVSAPMNKQVKG
ncbi:MAG: MFS transporter [Clostridia bacterium]|nr:MFS transporter [Clostridia bacterium]